MRELQRQRQRAKGVSLEAKGVDAEADALAEGGAEEAAVDHSLDSTFTSQVDSGEVDPNMLKYIEEQMHRADDAGADGADGASKRATALDPEEEELYTTPAHLVGVVPGGSVFAEEESANRWLAGIMEVPLSTDDKISAIERTEDAKRKMMASKAERAANKAANPRGDVIIPGNYNANFHQHRREFAVTGKGKGKGGGRLGGGKGGRGKGSGDASDARAYGSYVSHNRHKKG